MRAIPRSKGKALFFERRRRGEEMRIGLIGLPGSGKTTVFNALTQSEAPVSGRGHKAEPNVAIVKVMDERVDRLSEVYEPRKTVYATVEFVDFAGPNEGANGGSFAGAALATMKTMDALALVVRNFEDPLQGEPPTVPEDIRHIEEEMLLADLMVAETRIERIEKGYSRGQRTENLVKEEKVLRSILDQLNRNKPIREMDLTPPEEKVIRGFQFLTSKPLMIVVNSDEPRFRKNRSLMEELERGYRTIEFAGQFEMELGRLDEEEAKLFMEDMGISESAYRRLTKLSYDTLGYISFFTVGSDEVRAWNVRNGDTALDAAATIHTDLARGFIRAECFTYDDCLQYGSEKRIREKGLFRLEGRDYPVQDGDILSIRFNV
jgi:ribosome-binding ATPase